MHDAGIDNPGTMAAVLGLDDDQVEIACRLRRQRGLGGQLQRPRPGRHRRLGRGRRRGRRRMAKELGAKKVMPLPVSGAFHTPFMAPARDRLRKAIAEAEPARHRGPGRLQRRRPPPRPGRASGPACCRPSCPARCAGSTASSTLDGRRRHRLRRARPGRRAHRHGQAHRRRGAHASSVATPDELDKLLELRRRRQPAPPPVPLEGEHLFAAERLVVSPAAGRVHPRRRARTRARASASATCSATWATTRCARRSPACCRATSRSTASGSRCRQPIAWLRTA